MAKLDQAFLIPFVDENRRTVFSAYEPGEIEARMMVFERIKHHRDNTYCMSECYLSCIHRAFLLVINVSDIDESFKVVSLIKSWKLGLH